jgi:hypothetical protein
MIGAVSALSLETIVVRASEPLAAPVDGELVMLDPRRSRYYGLDAIGNRIWDLLEQPRSVGDLCSQLQGEFDVSAEACRTDVLALLEEMDRENLVEVR